VKKKKKRKKRKKREEGGVERVKGELNSLNSGGNQLQPRIHPGTHQIR